MFASSRQSARGKARSVRPWHIPGSAGNNGSAPSFPKEFTERDDEPLLLLGVLGFFPIVIILYFGSKIGRSPKEQHKHSKTKQRVAKSKTKRRRKKEEVPFSSKTKSIAYR